MTTSYATANIHSTCMDMCSTFETHGFLYYESFILLTIYLCIFNDLHDFNQIQINLGFVDKGSLNRFNTINKLKLKKKKM